MNNLGDYYAVVLHDDGLRAACTAADPGEKRRRWSLAVAARASLAAGLRALAAVVDASGATVSAAPNPIGLAGRTRTPTASARARSAAS